MTKAEAYGAYCVDMIETIMREEKENILKAAEALKNTYENGGLLYAFGTGHSTILCQEPYSRAGGFVPVYPILDERLMCHTRKPPEIRFLERECGVTEEIFKQYPIKKGDTMMIFCYGGRNPTSVEAGMLCKELGVTSISITSLEHANAVASLHPSGLKAHETCDIVIDTHGPLGDAAIEIGKYQVGPISTIAGAVIVQAITCEAADMMIKDGYEPEILMSMNIPGGDENNKAMTEKWKKVIHIMS